MSISGAAKLAGVIGWPVAHSLSPCLHNHWIAEHGLDAAYVPLAVPREAFATVILGLAAAGFRGLSVTLPHKEAAYAIAARSDEAARITGAANLLVLGEAGAIEGRNTDVTGLADSLRVELGPGALTGKPAIVWGAGGAARGAVLALAVLGASHIRILNRDAARAASLAASLAPHVGAQLSGSGYGDWEKAAEDAALLVNATSAGLKGSASLDLPLEALPAPAAVCDIVYNPLETPLLARARKAGRQTVDGLGMLLHQAVPHFAAFFGVTPKVTPAARRLLEDALG